MTTLVCPNSGVEELLRYRKTRGLQRGVSAAPPGSTPGGYRAGHAPFTAAAKDSLRNGSRANVHPDQQRRGSGQTARRQMPCVHMFNKPFGPADVFSSGGVNWFPQETSPAEIPRGSSLAAAFANWGGAEQLPPCSTGDRLFADGPNPAAGSAPPGEQQQESHSPAKGATPVRAEKRLRRGQGAARVADYFRGRNQMSKTSASLLLATITRQQGSPGAEAAPKPRHPPSRSPTVPPQPGERRPAAPPGRALPLGAFP